MNSIAALKYAASLVEVPFELLRAICTIESGLKPEAYHPKDGHSASYGMCQIKAETAIGFGFKGNPHKLFNAGINAIYAAKYLKYQLDRYQGDWVKAISAYNAGTFTTKNPKYVTKVFAELIKEELNVRPRFSYSEYPKCAGAYSK